MSRNNQTKETPALAVRALLCAAARINSERPGTKSEGHALAALPHPTCGLCVLPAALLLSEVEAIWPGVRKEANR